jgi:hypothetical protein
VWSLEDIEEADVEVIDVVVGVDSIEQCLVVGVDSIEQCLVVGVDSIEQCFSTFVRPRSSKFFFHKKRVRS